MNLTLDAILSAHGIGGGSGSAQSADVLSGKTFTANIGYKTGTMPNHAGDTQASKVITLQNLIQNGSFENGSTGWDLTHQGTGMSISTNTSKYGSNSLLQTNQGGTWEQTIPNSGVVGHKYYMSVWGYITSASAYNMVGGLCATGSGSVGWITLDMGKLNTWQFGSTVNTCTVLPVQGWAGVWGDARTASCYADGITIIDLTAAFGAGNEPTQAQMDALLNALGGWFDGTSLALTLPSGGYVTNGASGSPEVLTNDSKLIPSNIVSTATVLGIAGAAIVGKRSATGTGTTDASGKLTVTGLAFTPSIVIAATPNGIEGGVFNTAVYCNKSYGVWGTADISFDINASQQVTGTTTTIPSNGFTITTTLANTSQNWLAIE